MPPGEFASGWVISPPREYGRRYRYYVSRALIADSGAVNATGWRLPAHEVEAAVIRIVAVALTEPALLIERLEGRDASAEATRRVIDRAAGFTKIFLHGAPGERTGLVRELIERVVVDDAMMSVTMRTQPLVADGDAIGDNSADGAMLLSAPVGFRRRGIQTKLVLPAAIERQKPGRVDAALVKAVARSHAWFDDLAAGRAMSIEGIAAREGLTEGYVRRLIRLAFLARDIVEAILDGRQPAELTAASLTRRINLPLDWRQQAECTGF